MLQVSRKQLKRVRHLVRQLNPDAELHVTREAVIPLPAILNTGRFSLEKVWPIASPMCVS
jgi:G3E family GTPase